MVFCLSADEIDTHWHLFEHHLKRLESKGLILASDMRLDLKGGLRQLWGYRESSARGDVINGVAITHVYNTPRGQLCEVAAGVGTETTRGQIDAIHAAIEKWAASIGCTRMRIQGRRGWQRRLKDYRQVGVILEKQL